MNLRAKRIWQYADQLEAKLREMKREAIKKAAGSELPGALSVCEAYSTVIKRLAEGAEGEEQ